MLLLQSHSAASIFKHAAGAAGSSETSPLSIARGPDIYGLLNCLICMWYGSPFVSDDNILIVSVNSLGAAFQMIYIVFFITYDEHSIKVSNVIGTALGIIQLLFYAYYCRESKDKLMESLV